MVGVIIITVFLMEIRYSPSFAPCNTNSCNTDSPDLPDDNSNYMDYTGCTPMHFTQGQKQRMISGLENGRRSLITSKACVPVVPLDGSKGN